MINDSAETIDRCDDETQRDLQGDDHRQNGEHAAMVDEEEETSQQIHLEHQVEHEPVQRGENRRDANVHREKVVPIVKSAQAKDRNQIDQRDEQNQTEQRRSQVRENYQKIHHVRNLLMNKW